MAEGGDKDLCSICLEHFKQPKILDCQHFFCLQCLDEYVHTKSSNGHFPCPICRSDLTLPEGGVNNLPSKSTSGVPCCQGLTDDCFNPCEFRCRQCDQYLCRDCRRAHDLLRISKHHEVYRWDQPVHREDEPNEDSKPVHDERDLCACPRRKKVKFLCCDCKMAICSKCCFIEHNGHKLQDLQDEDVREEIRNEVNKLNDQLKMEIKRFEDFSEGLKKVDETPIERVCEQIEAQVLKVCEEVRLIGENMKEELTRIYLEHEENTRSGSNYVENLQKLIDDIQTETEEMKASVKDTLITVEDTSIVPIVERLDQLRQKVEDCRSRKLVIPDVPVMLLEAGEIDRQKLSKQVGNIIGQGIFLINGQDVKTANIHRSMRCKKLTWSIDIARPTFGSSILNKWALVPVPVPTDNLVVKLSMIASSNPNIESCKAKYNIQIVNIKDEERTISLEEVVVFIPGSQKRKLLPISFSTLIDDDYGFMDENGQFKIIVKIHEISY